MAMIYDFGYIRNVGGFS